jgi:uncharacterized membrane protein YfcA
MVMVASTLSFVKTRKMEVLVRGWGEGWRAERRQIKKTARAGAVFGVLSGLFGGGGHIVNCRFHFFVRSG